MFVVNRMTVKSITTIHVSWFSNEIWRKYTKKIKKIKPKTDTL